MSWRPARGIIPVGAAREAEIDAVNDEGIPSLRGGYAAGICDQAGRLRRGALSGFLRHWSGSRIRLCAPLLSWQGNQTSPRGHQFSYNTSEIRCSRQAIFKWQ